MNAETTLAVACPVDRRVGRQRDVVEYLRALERQSEDNIWRTAKEAREEIERLREENFALRQVAKPTCLRVLLEDRADVASIALRKAWQLGQTYWQQADSEYTSQHKKADVTQAKFQTLVDETRAAIMADVTPNERCSGGRASGSPGT